VRVATFNVNSVRARMPILRAWLERHQPDCLALQETKVRDEEFPVDAFREAGYHVVYRGQKGYNGVALASREEPADVAAGLGDSGPPDEPRLIRAAIAGVPIINTYVPQGTAPDSPHFRYKIEWLGRLRAFFEREYAPDRPLVWVGDLNVAPEPIDVYDHDRLLGHICHHPDEFAALNEVVSWGFVDVFRRHRPEPGQYTFFDYRLRGALARNLGWRVDHIFATAPLAAQSTGAFIDLEPRRAERPSDHTVLAAEFDLG
jgi:exodeoxyribonuclease-3